MSNISILNDVLKRPWSFVSLTGMTLYQFSTCWSYGNYLTNLPHSKGGALMERWRSNNIGYGRHNIDSSHNKLVNYKNVLPSETTSNWEAL